MTHRRILLIVVTAVFVAVAGFGLVLLLLRTDDGDQDARAGDGPTTTVAVGDEPPRPGDVPSAVGPEIVLAEGTVPGTDVTWELSGFEAEDGQLCLLLGGMACGPRPTRNDPLQPAVSTTRGGTVTCSYGAVDGSVSAVVIRFRERADIQTPALDARTLPTDFYATCWEGDAQPHAIEYLDDDGTIRGSLDLDIRAPGE